jgi:lantibiotic modifying enzyme
LLNAPIPFAAALAPWLEGAAARLETVPDLAQLLASQARAELVAGLAQELAAVTAQTLLERFLHHPGRWPSPRSRVAHDQFVGRLLAGAMDRLLSELPVLAQIIEQVIDGWFARVSRMVGRVGRDRNHLDQFSVRPPFARAVAPVDTVVELADGSGVCVLYKDRSLGMDAAFCELLRWINAKGPPCPLLIPGVVDRGAYGWMAYVPERPASGPADRRAYLTRAGMLACLVHAIGGGDVHAGNVRACGEHPVIIDGEVLLRPRRAGHDDPSPATLATGWLPSAHEVERCGLLAGLWQDRQRRWSHVGTDAIRQRPLRSPLAPIRPEIVRHFRGMLGAGTAQLCAGFAEMYALIAARGLPLEVFAQSRPRVLLRTSYLYQETIERSLQPAALSSAGDRAALIDRLVRRVPLALEAQPVADAVADAERSAMLALAVPRFTTSATGRELFIGGALLGTPFRESPIERAHRFIASMSPSAMEAQCRVIAAAIAAVAAGSLEPAAWHMEILPRFDVEAR